MAQTSTIGLSPDTAKGLARGLGWFSIALGLAELTAPAALCRRLGMKNKEALVQGYGMREILSGLGILASDKPAAWMWSRVAGDALDLATLNEGNSVSNPRKGTVQTAMAAVAAISLLDLACAGALQSEQFKRKQSMRKMRDYSNRVGMPRPPEEMRGAAADSYIAPDMLTPELMRYTDRAG